jgi:hypothetical protein
MEQGPSRVKLLRAKKQRSLPFHGAVITRAPFCELQMIISSKYLEQSLEGGTNAIPESFALLAHRSCVARSHHGGCENVTYDVRPDAQRKNRATANYESARSNDDLGSNGHGVRRVSRQLHRSAVVALIDVKKQQSRRVDHRSGFALSPYTCHVCRH